MSDDYPWNDGRQTEYYTAVGYLCQQWNVLELLYTYRASDLMGIKRVKHDLIFRHFGIVAIGQFMNEYAEHRIKSEEARKQLAYVTRYVDRCRINRNVIVHGWAHIGDDLSAIKITSKADQRHAKRTEFFIGLKDVKRVCDDIEMAGRLIVAVSFLFDKKGINVAKRMLGVDWQARLYAKFPLPELVAVNPQKTQMQSRQRRSSFA